MPTSKFCPKGSGTPRNLGEAEEGGCNELQRSLQGGFRFELQRKQEAQGGAGRPKEGQESPGKATEGQLGPGRAKQVLEEPQKLRRHREGQ